MGSQFNIETADTDTFREELRLWKSIDISNAAFYQIPPLTIEVVLLTRDLTANQTLVLLGKNGQRWDVGLGGLRKKLTSGEIVLERWSIEWQVPHKKESPELPVAYKKSIVVFRSLFSLARLLPAWRLRKKLAKSKLTGTTLKVACRVGNIPISGSDQLRVSLNQSLVQGADCPIDKHCFHSVDTPAGRFAMAVEYRRDCDFRVDDSEALLSSQFLTSDHGLFNRPQSSLPSEVVRRAARQGSLPLAHAHPVHMSGAQSYLPHSLTSEVRPASNTSLTRSDRRPSTALIQPFKTPSLSASPSLEHLSSSPRQSPSTPSSMSIERTRSANHLLIQRVPSSLGESSPCAVFGSPRQNQAPQLVKRYSSSFGQRKGSFTLRRRTSQSYSEYMANLESSTTRGSSRSPAMLIPPDVDDEEVGAFISLLDRRTPLAGTHFKDETTAASRILSASSAQKATHDLLKFQRLKDSHMVLVDSLMQSTIAQENASTETTSSKRPSPPSVSVPMLSTSPSKQISPHTPAIPSRLSESSVMPRLSSRNTAQAYSEIRTDVEDVRHGLSQAGQQFRVNQNSGLDLEHMHTRSSSGSLQDGSQEEDHGVNAQTTVSLQATIQRSQSAMQASTRLSAEDRPRGLSHKSSQLYNQVNPGILEDDDLFFAMSDIHGKS